MTYIRHRQRMVQESIFEDLCDTLIACRWFVGTTVRTVLNPANNTLQHVTTAESDVYPLMAKEYLEILDEYPSQQDEQKSPRINTLVIDSGTSGESSTVEMGNSSLRDQPYIFSMAFFAESDALAAALLSDLKDRYEGRLVGGTAIALYDYLTDPNVIVGWLEIDIFRFNKDPGQVSSEAGQLYVMELAVLDYIG